MRHDAKHAVALACAALALGAGCRWRSASEGAPDAAVTTTRATVPAAPAPAPRAESAPGEAPRAPRPPRVDRLTVVQSARLDENLGVRCPLPDGGLVGTTSANLGVTCAPAPPAPP